MADLNLKFFDIIINFLYILRNILKTSILVTDVNLFLLNLYLASFVLLLVLMSENLLNGTGLFEVLVKHELGLSVLFLQRSRGRLRRLNWFFRQREAVQFGVAVQAAEQHWAQDFQCQFAHLKE
jgi:hypothetical protein